ncbi:MAG: Small, acid-soluble spore protein H [Pelotomaculum sp. PtaB.Bin104]|nr:MAG: Small, acid-soluble spore protein H [Pelotomaculum sp. PtaB.Bin104]
MDLQRAQEIAVSPIMVNVTYNGSPVYIEHVDQVKQTVTVHPLDNPKSKKNVPVTSLFEL